MNKTISHTYYFGSKDTDKTYCNLRTIGEVKSGKFKNERMVSGKEKVTCSACLSAGRLDLAMDCV